VTLRISASIACALSLALAGCSARFTFDPPSMNGASNGLARQPAPPPPPVFSIETDDAAGAPIVASATTAGAAAPASTQPVALVRLADAQPLERRLGADANVDFSFVLRPVNAPQIYFGQINHQDGKGDTDSTEPILATRPPDSPWRATGIELGREFPNGTWMYVGAGPRRGEAWAVLDSDSDLKGMSDAIAILHSEDGGQTWSATIVEKPTRSATYDSFCLGPQHGRLTVYQPAGERAARPGYYHFATLDGGRTWAPPTFEPDALTPADPVGDKDQPDVPNSATEHASAR
jgi:hypothetical protein